MVKGPLNKLPTLEILKQKQPAQKILNNKLEPSEFPKKLDMM